MGQDLSRGDAAAADQPHTGGRPSRRRNDPVLRHQHRLGGRFHDAGRHRVQGGFLVLDEKFSAGEATPAEIVIDGDIDSQPVQSGIERLRSALEGDSSFSPARELQVNDERDLALLVAPVEGDFTSLATQDAIKRLRNTHVPAAFDGVDATVLVTGETAFNIDFFKVSDDAALVVFPFVLGMSFLLLLLVFRSIVMPLKAIILNLLSVGATYGILVLIFQKGVGNEVFGFQQAEAVEAWLPIFLFAVLFGLSMDYHVFLLSRIRERYDQTKNNTESVAFGIRSTGRLVTGAALIMVAVFWGFAAGDLVGLQPMGFGLGLAVLLDATIVRMVLVPASMRLLGRWNWYLPPFLRWLPDLRVEVEEEPAAQLATDPTGDGSRLRLPPTRVSPGSLIALRSSSLGAACDKILFGWPG